VIATVRQMDAWRRFCLFLLVCAAAGCGKDEGKKAATQVAARVNSTEITVSQVSNVLARAPGIAPQDAPAARRAILDGLIEQELARQQAVDKKLDRLPAVMQAIESAKTEILARAYSERVGAAQAKPTPEEVKRYYAEHPELFAQRRVFNVEELNVAPAPGIGPALADKAAKARSLQEVADWLKSRGVKFGASRGVRAAEQMPMEILPKLHAMKDGEMRAFETAGGTWQVIRVAASQPAPVDEATAAPRIQQFLSRQRSAQLMAQEMKRVKEGAKIEYLGEFAAGAKVIAQQKAPEKVAAPVTTAPVATAPVTTAPVTTALPQQAIEKGVGGMR
jgi:EpsD family peptidyl-prolyl cis-trans isomerase